MSSTLFGRLTIALTAIASVIALGVGAEAAHKHRHHALRSYIARCNTPVYYYEYSRWCAALFRVAGIDRSKTYTKEYGAIPPQDNQQYVTIRRDTQANTNVGPSDPYIVLQTANDIARSPQTNGAFGWVPSVAYFGWVHPPLLTARAQATHIERKAAQKAPLPTPRPY